MNPDIPRRGRARTLVTVGLLALPVVGSAVALPAIANASGATPSAVLATGARQSPPAVVTDEAAAEAFRVGGYSYADAELLASIWGLPDAYAAKVKAGSYLVRGVALADSPLADPTVVDGVPADDLARVFLDSGYTSDDAALLAESWGLELGEAKVAAGTQLKTLGILPFVDPAPPAQVTDDEAVAAFFAAGYSYADAEALSQIWGRNDPYLMKVKAGDVLRRGSTLEESMSDPSLADGLTPEDLTDLFFAAGYTAEDAALLAENWGLELGEAKAAAGTALKTVGVLPFVDVVLPGAAG